MKILRFNKARLNEKSTYVAIVAAIGIAALLPAPWSYASVIVGVLGAIIPTSQGAE